MTILELSILDQAICETDLRRHFLDLVQSHAVQYKAPVFINKLRYPKLFVLWVKRIGIKLKILFVEEFNDLFFDLQEMTDEQIRNKIDDLRDNGFEIPTVLSIMEHFNRNDFWFWDSLLHDQIAESEILDVLTVLNDCGSLKLEALSLKNSSLKTSSVLKLSRIFDHLQKLCISRCDIQLVEYIVQIPSFGLLRFLDLRNIYTAVHSEEFDHVVTKIANCCTKLQYLFLDRASITDIALFALSKGCCQLVELSLRNCDDVTYRGLEDLMKGCPTLRKLDIGQVFRTWGYDETNIIRTLAGSQIEHLMIQIADAYAYVLFLAWEVLQLHPTFPQKYGLHPFELFWRCVLDDWRDTPDSLDNQLSWITKRINGSQNQFKFYMDQFKELENLFEVEEADLKKVDMRMNFSAYIKNPHESVLNFLKMESRDEREAIMTSVFVKDIEESEENSI